MTKTIAIKVYPYMTTGGDPVEVNAPCRIVGDLAVHRAYSAWQGEASPTSAWTVTHIATGLLADADGEVTCKFCLAKMGGSQ